MGGDPLEQTSEAVLADMRTGGALDALADVDPRDLRAVLEIIGDYDAELFLEVAVEAVQASLPAARRRADVHQLPVRRSRAL